MKNAKVKFGIKYLFWDFVRVTGAPCWLYFRPKVYYAAHRYKIEGGALICANHSTFADPFIIMLSIWNRRHRFVCIKDIFEKAYGFVFKGFRCIPIDRDDFSMATFKEIVSGLKNEELITIFPEGHINTTDEILDSFKSGMVLMSLSAKKPIIPVYIEKRKNIWKRYRCVIGEPIKVWEMYGNRPTKQEIEKITEHIFQKEIELEKILGDKR